MVYGEAPVQPRPWTPSRRAPAGGVTDEFVEPGGLRQDGTISDNDSVIFFNFRPDRAREITRTLVDPGLRRLRAQGLFPRPFRVHHGYDATMPNVEVAFPRPRAQRPRRVPQPRWA